METILFYIILSLYWLISFGNGRNVPPFIELYYWVPPHHECKTWEKECQPTIRYTIDFNADYDAKIIYKALRRQNNQPLINILSRRAAVERYYIGKALVVYKRNKLKTLWDIVRSYPHMSMDLKKMAAGLMMPPTNFHRREFRKALNAQSHKYELLMDTIGVLSTRGIKVLLPSVDDCFYYQDLSWMIDTYCADLSNSAKEFFSLLHLKKEGDELVAFCVDSDAKRLIKAALTGGDLIELAQLEFMFRGLNNVSLREVYRLFHLATNQTFGDKLEEGVRSGNEMYQIFNMYYKVTDNRAKYFAERLYTTLRDQSNTEAGKDFLNKILIGRAEIDLMNIKDAYLEKYGHTVERLIMEKIEEGEYREACLKMLSGPPAANMENESSWNSYLKLYKNFSILVDDDDYDLEETASTSNTSGCTPFSCFTNNN